MKVSFGCIVALSLIGCNNPGASETADSTPAAGGAQGQAGDGSGEIGSGEMAPPIQVASGTPSLVGVTADGWTIFRDGDALKATKLSEDAQVQDVASKAGSVVIRGGAVFNWADMDWMANTGDLSVWSASLGNQEIGTTPYVEALVAANDDGTSVLYPANATSTVVDIMILDANAGEAAPLIENLGLVSEKTCGAKLGFVGKDVLAGWCEPKSTSAVLQRYTLGDDGWSGATIADRALPIWSADSSGTRIFYQSIDYQGIVSDNGTPTMIDVSVSGGQITPDGSAVLYTVGDQLRRANVDDIEPTPIVTTGYKQPVQLSADFGLALYSTTVTYEQGTQRDLLLVPTDGFHSTPITLVRDPVATLGRSAMTRDGRFIAYFTDMTASGGTLHVVDADGTERLTRENVVEVAAGVDSTLLFTDNSSDPNAYPVVADLNVVDLAADAEPKLVEASVLDGKNFQVDPSGTSVAYVRSGVDRSAAEQPTDVSTGLFYRSMLR
ncbi:MAG TPA: hypothetical protein VHB79_02795 [Polyangiaceae bacterium]|nr:hypothetical protein [Polyangiaceae bacterium]